MAARSKAWVCGYSLAGIVCSNLAGAWMSFSYECCVFCTGLCVSLITRPESPTECDVSEYDREASTLRRLSIHEKNIRNIQRLSCKVPSIFVWFYWNLNFLDRVLKQYSSNKFHETPFSGSRGVTRRRTDGRTDREKQTDMTKLVVVFRDFVIVPNNWHFKSQWLLYVTLVSMFKCYVHVYSLSSIYFVWHSH